MESFKILPLEQQISALKYSKCFKKLGVEQESLWYWIFSKRNNRTFLLNCNDREVNNYRHPDAKNYFEVYSAFTVAELGGMLPDEINGYEIACWKKKMKWGIAYYCAGMEVVDCNNYLNNKIELADTEANVRAKMLIYLLEKGDL